MIEFTMIAPVFFLMLLGVLDLGRAGFYYVAVSDVARSGARYNAAYSGGSGYSAAEVKTYMLTEANAMTMANLTQISTGTCARPTGAPTLACQQPAVGSTYFWAVKCISACSPSRVTVTVVYAFRPTTPMVSALTGTIYIWSTTTMDTEYWI